MVRLGGILSLMARQIVGTRSKRPARKIRRVPFSARCRQGLVPELGEVPPAPAVADALAVAEMEPDILDDSEVMWQRWRKWRRCHRHQHPQWRKVIAIVLECLHLTRIGRPAGGFWGFIRGVEPLPPSPPPPPPNL